MSLENLPEISRPYGHYSHGFTPVEKVEVTMKDGRRFIGYVYGKENGILLLASSVNPRGTIVNLVQSTIEMEQIRDCKIISGKLI